MSTERERTHRPERSPTSKSGLHARRQSSNNVQGLMLQCQGLVRSIAWQILQKLPPQADLDEMIQDGNIGLLEAANKFEEDRGIRFATFAFHRVRGAIRDGLARQSWFNLSDFHGSRYDRSAQDFLDTKEQDEGDSPLTSLDGNLKWFKDVVVGLTVSSLALSAASHERAGHREPKPVSVPPSHHVLAMETCDVLRRLIDALPAEPRTLMRAMYFEEKSLTDAAAELGISKSWGSRLHAKTLRRLGNALRELGVGG